MRAIVIQSPWNAAAVEREIPRPKEGEALLKMICGGICGSDLASYRGMSAYVSYPRTIGHEFAAEVVEVGDNVYGIKPGMIVTGNPYFNCGTCYSCRRGMVNCCVRNETMGVQREGAFSDYLTMPVGRLYDGQGIDPKELALIEPFCISCHGVSRASVKPGDKVLVFGAGAIGILAGVAAKSFGARVYITDIAGEKVEAAVRDFHLDGGFVNESRERLDAFVQEITDGRIRRDRGSGGRSVHIPGLRAGGGQQRARGGNRCGKTQRGFQFPGAAAQGAGYVRFTGGHGGGFCGGHEAGEGRICGSEEADFQNLSGRKRGGGVPGSESELRRNYQSGI